MHPYWYPHLKGYQPDSFFYGFPKVSTAFRHSFGLLFWRMSENNHIAKVERWGLSEWVVRKRERWPLLLPVLVKSQLSRLIYYWIDIWKTAWELIIKNVCHVSVNIMDLIWSFLRRCRDRNFRWISQQTMDKKQRYFGYKNNLYGTKGTFAV